MSSVERISKEDLKEKIEAGADIQLVNVLEPKYYHLGWIRGSQKIPLSELEARANELHQSKEIAVYCANTKCDASRKAADRLSAMGYNVKDFEGGIKEWEEAGYPLEN